MFTKEFKRALKGLIGKNAEEIIREYNQDGLSWEERRLLKKAIKENNEKNEEKKKENKRP